MAELTATDPAATSSCCSTEAQANCCEPSEKAECCGTSAAEGTCGCSADPAEPAEADIRETVRERYAEAARAVAGDAPGSCGCSTASTVDAEGREVFGAVLYGDDQVEGATDASVQASLGCGVPTAVADLHEGETVLDLGSGAGADVLISAQRVGATGRAIGLDMTDEMLDLARANAAQAGVSNVEFVKGYIEEIPLPDASVDVVISNCVINLAADKRRVIAETARVLRPGGRFAVSDVIADPDMDEATKADMQQWTGCIAGALTEQEFRSVLADAGLVDVEIQPTHRVHAHAESAIIRAHKPATAASDSATAEAPQARQVELYEPAMCCQTGVCGPSVDQQLIDVREDLRWAESTGASVTRHNLSSDPDAFVANPKVTGLMAAFGDGALPAVFIDGEIAVHGRYPSRDELAGLLSTQPTGAIELKVTDSDCGCEPGGCC